MNKMFHIDSVIKGFEEDDEDLIIRGMASTTDKDRMGDIIESSAWKKGLANFRKNPIILYNHNHNRPIGKAKAVSMTEHGLEIEAKISKSAPDVIALIKEKILQAFSVGFMVKDAEYDRESDTFLIKQAELLEVSVVSVPANQAATFSIKKEFNTEEDYQKYVKSFSVDLASGHLAEDSDDDTASNTPEGSIEEPQMEKLMTPEEIQEMMKEMARELSKANALERAQEKAAAEAAKKAAEEAAATEAAKDAHIAAVVKSGAEELVKDLTARLAEKEAKFEEIIGEFKGELEQKSEEIQKMRESRYNFTDRKSTNVNWEEELSDEAVDAHILGEMTRKGLNTSLGKRWVEKATNANTGVSAPTATEENFETIVSTRVERDIELELVLAPLFRTIQMNAASMVIPTMPDAGYAEFLATGSTAGTGASTAFKGNLEARDAASPGANSGIAMGNKVLTVEKLVSKSYIADETEEDAILPILPFIRESIVRAHARAVEHSILLGGSANDLISSGYNGLFKIAVDDGVNLDLGSPVGTATAASLLNLRQAMGKYGRRPGDVVYVVSLDAYYDLLDDAEFQNINEVGSERATKVRGEIGQIYGSAVIICDEFPAKVNGNPYAIAVNARNFVMPILRGARVEQDRDVENQRRVLVATQRRGFDQLFATAGQVVAHTW